MPWKKIVDQHIEEFLLFVTMVIMVVTVFMQAFSRYFFGNFFIGSDEVARYIHIWQIWIGASFAIRKGEHIRITVLRDICSERVKFYMDVMAQLCWFAFAFFLAVEGSLFVHNILISNQTSPGLSIPLGFPYLAIPVGGLLMCIRLIQQIYLTFKGRLVQERGAS